MWGAKEKRKEMRRSCESLYPPAYLSNPLVDEFNHLLTMLTMLITSLVSQNQYTVRVFGSFFAHFPILEDRKTVPLRSSDHFSVSPKFRYSLQGAISYSSV